MIIYTALLAADAVPVFLFEQAHAKFGELLASLFEGDGVETAIEALLNFSLVYVEEVFDERDPSFSTRSIRLHRLVREIAAERRTPDERARMRTELIAALDSVHPRETYSDSKVWRRVRRLDGHARYLVYDHAPPPEANLESVVRLLNLLAEYRHGAIGNYTEAKEMFSRALEISKSIPDQAHPVGGMTYHGLGWLSATMDNYIDAAELFQKALLIRENALGADPIDTAETRHRLGWVYVYQGKYEEADALLKRALEAFEAKPDSWSVTKAAPYVTMGWLYLSWGRYDEALDYVLKGRAIEDSHGASNTVVTASLHNLGRIYLRLNRLSDADREFQRTLELRINLHGPNHLEVAKTLTDVGELRVAQSRLNEAEDCFTEAAAKLRANGIESPRRHANISAGRAELRLKQQQPAEAESLARSMLETFESGHPWRARIQWLLARALMAQGMSPERESEAKELLHDAIATLQRKVAPEHVWLDGARRTLRELERSGTPNPL